MRVTGRRWLLGIGVVALLIAVAGALSLRVDDSHPPAAFDETPIPEPPWGERAPVARDHVREVRQQLEEARSSETLSASALADAYGELGRTYLAYDIPASAVACFENATRLDRDDFQWPYLEALAHKGLHDAESAAAAMTEALRRQRRDTTTAREHRVAALCFLGEADFRLNRLGDARACFDEALRLAPDSVFAMFKRGQLASRAGDSRLAVRSYQDALTHFRGAAPKPIVLALAAEYQRLGQNLEADRVRSMSASASDEKQISYVDPLHAAALALNRHPSAVLARAESAAARGDLPTALSQVDFGLATSPKSVKLRLLRAQTLLKLNRVQDAIRDLQSVTQAEPHHEQARVLLIETLAASPGTSQQALIEAIAWQSERPEALRPRLVLAALQFQVGRYEESYESYQTACGMFPGEPSPQLGAIIALCALRRYEKARVRFDEAHASFSEDDYLKHQYARFLVTCPDATVRDAERGLAIIEELLSTENTAPLNETLACALAACGQTDEARRRLADLASRAEVQSQRSLRARLEAIGAAIDEAQPVTEPWPFELSGDGDPTSQ